jgi:TonB family protein
MKTIINKSIHYIVVALFALPLYGFSSTLNMPSDSVCTKVDKLPIFKMHKGNIQKYLSKNIKYPLDAFAKEIEGKVIVSCIITKEGKLIDPLVKRGLCVSIDNEALRVISSMQAWKPGVLNEHIVNTRMSITVHFYLKKENRHIAQQLKPFYIQEKTPLFIINDKKVKGLTYLDYYNIKSIRVMKGKKAVQLYGNDAQFGVVIIQTKQGNPCIYQRY